MKAVLAQFVLLGDGGGYGVRADVLGDGLVELAVEDGDVAGRGQIGQQVFDNLKR